MDNISITFLGSSLAWRRAEMTSSREAKDKAPAKALKILLCSSSSVVETTPPFSLATGLETWGLLFFFLVFFICVSEWKINGRDSTIAVRILISFLFFFFFFFPDFSYFIFIQNLKLKKEKKKKEQNSIVSSISNGNSNWVVTKPWIDKNWKLEDWIDKTKSYRTEMKNSES